MQLLAAILAIWLATLLLGTLFGALGKVIWIAILATVIAALWKFIKRKDKDDTTT